MNSKPARGMRDFLPEDVRRRQYVIGVVAAVYQRYGFDPLETPAIENIETLTGQYGEEGDRLIFRILKRGEDGKTGEADLALRYDLTVPLARVVAEYRATLPKFFKRYQVQPVWRADRPQKGRFREFYQCDVDAIGSRSAVVEAELLGAASEILERLGFQQFRIRLSHRKVLAAALQTAGVPADRHAAALIALDKLDKSDAQSVEADLIERGIETGAAAALLALLHVDGTHTLDDLHTRVGGSGGGAEGVDELRAIATLSQETPAADHISIDLTLARGLSYYTGSIFEITVPDLAGSLAGGGRYDNLIGRFLGDQVPACGISLGLERILVVMAERQMFPASLVASSADVMVTLWNADRTADALRLAGELRAAGLRADVYPEPDKIGKQFKYASSRHIRFVALVGDDEVAREEVAVKNLETGEQVSLPRARVSEHILAASTP
jgi:histidyl-tRNA synthetase